MLIVRGVNLFPSAVQEVVGELGPAISAVLRILADFPGHSTQSNLKVLVERGASADPSADSRTKTELESRIRNLCRSRRKWRCCRTRRSSGRERARFP